MLIWIQRWGFVSENDSQLLERVWTHLVYHSIHFLCEVVVTALLFDASALNSLVRSIGPFAGWCAGAIIDVDVNTNGHACTDGDANRDPPAHGGTNGNTGKGSGRAGTEPRFI
jgi:hypothetical protein